jgi:hypothetical protein
MCMFRALLPLLLTCGISAAAPPSPAGAAPKNMPVSRPQAQPAQAPTAPAKEAAPTQVAAPANAAANTPTPANSPANMPANAPAKPAKTDPAQEGLRSDSYRALISLIVMGTIALRHARSGSP